MSPFLRRLVPLAAIVLAILAGTFALTPVHAHETAMPHLIHEYEGWVALAVVVLSFAGAGVLITRALRR